jgi:hypothetical protein
MTGVMTLWKECVSPDLRVRVEHAEQWIWLELKYSVPSNASNKVFATKPETVQLSLVFQHLQDFLKHGKDVLRRNRV